MLGVGCGRGMEAEITFILVVVDETMLDMDKKGRPL